MTVTWVHDPPRRAGRAAEAPPGEPHRVVTLPAGVPVRNNPPNTAGAAADQWVPIGPSTILNGQATGDPRVSGRVRAMAVSLDGRRIYAGTALGGLWYSGDAGGRWMSLDFYATTRDLSGHLGNSDALAVGSVTVRFGADASTDAVWVGTGERPATGIDRFPLRLQGVGIRSAIGPVTAVTAGGPATDPWQLEAKNLAGAAVTRLAFDRVADQTLWAATSRGLYRRPVGNHDSWQHVDASFGENPVTDVAVLPGLAGEPQRIYAVSATGRLVRSTDGEHWTVVALPAFPVASVAASIPLQRAALAAGNIPGHAVVWVLAGGPRLWRVDGDTAEVVTGLPGDLFGTQAGYDMAIAVHPSTAPAQADLIAVGGKSAVSPGTGGDAAIYTGQVTRVGPAWRFPTAAVPAGSPPAEWAGEGVHADVQCLTWIGTAASAQLWVGCDGGIFRSMNDGRRGSFIPRNTGLPTIQVAAVAQHPDSAGLLLIGVQDNGVLRRRSGEVWQLGQKGDGGGVAIDGDDGQRMYAQHHNASWSRSTDGGRSFADMTLFSAALSTAAPGVVTAWSDAMEAEDKAAAWLSQIALINTPTGPRQTQLVIGTDRVWYSDAETVRTAGAGLSGWVTLPTATDPYDPARADAPNRVQDVLDGAVSVLRWGGTERLYAMSKGGVHLFERAAAGGWTRQSLYDQATVHRNYKGKVPDGQIPDNVVLTELAVHDPAKGKGSLYAGTTGSDDEQHLWWYDGTGAWLATGLRIGSPVHAVVVDPQHPEVVYAGTDVGVWKATATFPAAGQPSWAWTHSSDGLPEAPCADLLIHAPGGGAPRLLRAGLAGRGVWEVALDGVLQGREVYLRAAPYDTRRGPVPAGGAADPLRRSRSQLRLDASPDVRIWRSPGASAPVPAALPVGPGSDAYDIWLLQSALRAGGQPIAVDGQWSTALVAALAARTAALTPPLPAATTPKQVWDMIWAANRLPFDSDPPDAADLVSHLMERPDRWSKGGSASCLADDGVARVFVTVHSRHWRPLPANRVAVTLLKAPFGRHGNLAGTSPLPAGWAAGLTADRASGSPSGWIVASDWDYVDVTTPFRILPAVLDPDNPQVVSFDSVFDGAAWAKRGWLLLAVVVSDDDPLTGTETDVARLVATDRHVAARSVRQAHSAVGSTALLAGMDTSAYPGLATMDRAWARTNLTWTGLYLDSPAPVPGEAPPPAGVNAGHNRLGGTPGHPAGGWMHAWGELYPDWGLLPIYWGQQDPANGDGPFHPTPEMALANAADAAAKAATAGIPPAAVIYLDWEIGGVPSAAGVAYCKTLLQRLAELGYRPGIYCHPAASLVIRREIPGLYVWNVDFLNAATAAATGAAWTVVGDQLRLATPPVAGPGALTDQNALARQWKFGVHAPVGSPVAGLPEIDANTSIVADPAFPERRPQVGSVREGRVTVTAAVSARAAGYAVRRGQPMRATWSPGTGVRDTTLPTSLLPIRWNPYSPITGLHIAGPPGATDWLLALGYDGGEGEGGYPAERGWRVQSLRREAASSWRTVTIPDGGLVLDPLPGVTAVARAGMALQVFALDDGSGLPATARWDPAAHRWGQLHLLPGVGADAARRTNGLGALARQPDTVDVFWVGTDGRLRTSGSTGTAAWAAAEVIGDPAVQVHPMATPVPISGAPDRIDVLFLGRRTGETSWTLQLTWWTAADGWGTPGHSAVAGGAALAVDPLGRIAALTRTAGAIDAYAIGANGALVTTGTGTTGGAWTPLAAVGGLPVIGGRPLRLTSVDGCVSGATNEVAVLATASDGTVFATSWTAATAGYTTLEQIGPLAPA